MTLLEIFNALVAYGEGIKDKTLTTSELTQIIRSIAGSSDVRVQTRRSSEVDHNNVVICGAYDPSEDESGRPSISLYLTYNTDQKKVKIADLNWSKLCLDLVECSGHEMIHQNQFRSRGFDVAPEMFVSGSEDEPEYSYLANPDEIEAYGFSIAVEVFIRFNPKKIGSKHVSQVAIFKTYRDAFGASHQVVERLLDNAVRYYLQLSSLEASY